MKRQAFSRAPKVLWFSINVRDIFSAVPQIYERFPLPPPILFIWGLRDKLMGDLLCESQCKFQVPYMIWIWNPPWRSPPATRPFEFCTWGSRQLLIRRQMNSTAPTQGFGPSTLSQSLSTDKKLLPPVKWGPDGGDITQIQRRTTGRQGRESRSTMSSWAGGNFSATSLASDHLMPVTAFSPGLTQEPLIWSALGKISKEMASGKDFCFWRAVSKRSG